MRCMLPTLPSFGSGLCKLLRKGLELILSGSFFLLFLLLVIRFRLLRQLFLGLLNLLLKLFELSQHSTILLLHNILKCTPLGRQLLEHSNRPFQLVRRCGCRLCWFDELLNSLLELNGKTLQGSWSTMGKPGNLGLLLLPLRPWPPPVKTVVEGAPACMIFVATGHLCGQSSMEPTWHASTALDQPPYLAAIVHPISRSRQIHDWWQWLHTKSWPLIRSKRDLLAFDEQAKGTFKEVAAPYCSARKAGTLPAWCWIGPWAIIYIYI